MTKDIDREAYADLYGPSEGDRVRLADTELFAESRRTSGRTATRPSSAAGRRSATVWGWPPT